MSDIVQGEPRPVVELMKLAQSGDRDAFAELERVGEASGISYTDSWSSRVLVFRMQDRASTRNLLARASVADDLAAASLDLSDPRDGPVERLVVARAAVCAIDARMADLEHLQAIAHYDDPRDAEAFDRRRDRSQRRLLAALRALAEVRRMNRPLIQVDIGISPR